MNTPRGRHRGGWRTVFGLPFPALGWSDSFAMLEAAADVRVGCRTVSFLTTGKLLRCLVDRRYRAALADCVLLPADRWVATLLRLGTPGMPPHRFEAAAFVPAFLTYLDLPRRITLIGDDEQRLQAASLHLAARTPWHQVTTVLLSEPVCGRRPIAADRLLEEAEPDLVIADVRDWRHEHRLQRYLSFRHDGLALLGRRFFDVATTQRSVSGATVEPELTIYSPKKFSLS